MRKASLGEGDDRCPLGPRTQDHLRYREVDAVEKIPVGLLRIFAGKNEA